MDFCLLKSKNICAAAMILFSFAGWTQDPMDPAETARAWSELQSLAGKWQVRGLQNFEEWQVESDSTLTGEGYAQAPGDEKRILEKLRLVYHRDGSIDYEATVAGQNAGATVPFLMTTCDDGCWTFENPTHDFPQKIRYCIISDDTLQATVSGATRSFDMQFDRVKD